MVKIALYEPAIPPNTGNIGRLCVGFNISLLLIEPLGFSLTDKALRRAGLDYWRKVRYDCYTSLEALLAGERSSQQALRVVAFSKHGNKELYEHTFQAQDILLLGNEQTGIPLALTERYDIERIRIPMSKAIRSYNLANAAALVIGEAYRQLRWRLPR